MTATATGQATGAQEHHASAGGDPPGSVGLRQVGTPTSSQVNSRPHLQDHSGGGGVGGVERKKGTAWFRCTLSGHEEDWLSPEPQQRPKQVCQQIWGLERRHEGAPRGTQEGSCRGEVLSALYLESLGGARGVRNGVPRNIWGALGLGSGCHASMGHPH